MIISTDGIELLRALARTKHTAAFILMTEGFELVPADTGITSSFYKLDRVVYKGADTKKRKEAQSNQTLAAQMYADKLSGDYVEGFMLATGRAPVPVEACLLAGQIYMPSLRSELLEGCMSGDRLTHIPTDYRLICVVIPVGLPRPGERLLDSTICSIADHGPINL